MSIDYLKNFTAGEKIRADDTNSNNQYILSQIDNQVGALQTLLTAEMDEFKASVLSGALTIGDIKIAAYDTLPECFLICNGASLLISDYQTLYDKIGAQFGQEDALHFSLPDFRDRVPEGFKDSTEGFGTQQDGKLPNIKGLFGITNQWTGHGNTATGPFTFTNAESSNRCGDGGSYPLTRYVNFDASKASNVYSDDAKRASIDRIKVNFLIKYKD